MYSFWRCAGWQDDITPVIFSKISSKKPISAKTVIKTTLKKLKKLRRPLEIRVPEDMTGEVVSELRANDYLVIPLCRGWSRTSYIIIDRKDSDTYPKLANIQHNTICFVSRKTDNNCSEE